MAHVSQISASDTCFSALVAGLGREFGAGAAEGLARIFLDAEDADFHWDARSDTRILGTYLDEDDEDLLLDRVAVLGFLDGRFYVAILLIDSMLGVHGMLGLRHFGSANAAGAAFGAAR